MESSEFAAELRKIQEKDNVMENSYAMFQIREAVGHSQILLKKKVFLKIRIFHNESPVLEFLFHKDAGLKKSATLFKRDSSTVVFLRN